MNAGQPVRLCLAELNRCKPVQTKYGKYIRAFCPFHGSDHQRSLSIRKDNGYLHCFACGAWGYMEAHPPIAATKSSTFMAKVRTIPNTRELSRPSSNELANRAAAFGRALIGSVGRAYLESRKIPLDLAVRYNVGYAHARAWPNRRWRGGRLVIPHTDPTGAIVNLYGRAVGPREQVPKHLVHDHLPGSKGFFNAVVLDKLEDLPLVVCEGPFDALTFIAAGYPRTVAIFGVSGWRWDWVRRVRQIILALDGDASGQSAWPQLAVQACMRGIGVSYIPPDAYGGQKDANDAWVRGCLEV